MIGTGVRQSGTADTFADIDWTATPVFLKTLIFYQSAWKYMGQSKLWSVPYSLIAKDLDGSVPRLTVSGNTTYSDSALFEVKGNDGQTVFAVYPDAVNVYVPTGGKSTRRFCNRKL